MDNHARKQHNLEWPVFPRARHPLPPDAWLFPFMLAAPGTPIPQLVIILVLFRLILLTRICRTLLLA
jgi:hypothetical protein